MNDVELNVNLVLERLIKVRDEGKIRVIELTKISQENKKAQLFRSSQINTKPVVGPLLFPREQFLNVENIPLSKENLRTLEESFPAP